MSSSCEAITLIFSDITDAKSDQPAAQTPIVLVCKRTHYDTRLSPVFRHIESCLRMKTGTLAFSFKNRWLGDADTPAQLGMKDRDTIYHVKAIKIVILRPNAVSQFFTLNPDPSIKFCVLFSAYAAAASIETARLNFVHNGRQLRGEDSILEVLKFDRDQSTIVAMPVDEGFQCFDSGSSGLATIIPSLYPNEWAAAPPFTVDGPLMKKGSIPDSANVFISHLKSTLRGAYAEWQKALINTWPDPSVLVAQDDATILWNLTRSIMAWRDSVLQLAQSQLLDAIWDPNAFVKLQMDHICALEALHREWRAELLEGRICEPENRAASVLPSLREAIGEANNQRRLREAKLVSILGLVIRAWMNYASGGLQFPSNGSRLSSDADILRECRTAVVEGLSIETVLGSYDEDPAPEPPPTKILASILRSLDDHDHPDAPSSYPHMQDTPRSTSLSTTTTATSRATTTTTSTPQPASAAGSKRPPKAKRFRCSNPHCSKSYKQTAGLQAHLNSGSCRNDVPAAEGSIYASLKRKRIEDTANAGNDVSAFVQIADPDQLSRQQLRSTSSLELTPFGAAADASLGPGAGVPATPVGAAKKSSNALASSADSASQRRSTRLKEQSRKASHLKAPPKVPTKIEEPPDNLPTPTPPPLPLETLVTKPPMIMARRAKIQQEWNRIAAEAGAAGLEFVNDIDDEELPPGIGILFPYIERNYMFDVGITQPKAPTAACLCDSKRACAKECSCQVNLTRSYAYDSNGLFTFNTYSEIVECNDNCTCSTTCLNRVAQLPRQTPIQVFKTEKRGWGVRPTVDLVRGRVVGIYTGLLMLVISSLYVQLLTVYVFSRREEADRLSGPRSSYCFDLDINESLDEGSPDNAYSVDAHGCGNWSRFLNHSCSPNLLVISVVYNTQPEDNMPYIALVAAQDIPAFTEFTFDYNPAHQMMFERKKTKTRRWEKGQTIRKKSKTHTRCLCGTSNCRGWLSVAP